MNIGLLPLNLRLFSPTHKKNNREKAEDLDVIGEKYFFPQ